MGPHDAPGDVEAQAHPVCLSAGLVAPPAELLEDPFRVVEVDPPPMVRHLDADAPWGLTAHRPQLDRRAVRRILGGVAEKVAEHLADAVPVRPDLFFRLDLDGDRMIPGKRLGESGGVLEQLLDGRLARHEGEIPALDGAGAAHVANEGAQPVGFGSDPGQDNGLLGGFELAGRQHVQEPADGCERGADLVGDHRREVGPEGRQLAQVSVRLLQPLFRKLALGDVDRDAYDAGDLAGLRPQRRIPRLERPRVDLPDHAELLAGERPVDVVQDLLPVAVQLRDRTPDHLARLEPQSVQPYAFRERELAREVQGEQHDGHVGDDAAQPQLALFERLLRALALGDVELYALPKSGAVLLVPHQDGLVADPYHAPVSGDLPVLHTERLAGLVRAGVFGQHLLAVFGVQQLDPELGVFYEGLQRIA